MDHKNKFAAETVRQLQRSLDEVAPYQATELSKQQAIRTLSPQSLSLRSTGYSWTAVAAILSERGVPVSRIIGASTNAALVTFGGHLQDTDLKLTLDAETRSEAEGKIKEKPLI